jgi:hypothetical protein
MPASFYADAYGNVTHATFSAKRQNECDRRSRAQSGMGQAVENAAGWYLRAVAASLARLAEMPTKPLRAFCRGIPSIAAGAIPHPGGASLSEGFLAACLFDLESAATVAQLAAMHGLGRSHWHPLPEAHVRAQPLQSEAPSAQNAGKGTIWSVWATAVNTVYGVP